MVVVDGSELGRTWLELCPFLGSTGDQYIVGSAWLGCGGGEKRVGFF